MSVITVLLDTLADRRVALARVDADIEAKVPDLVAARSKLQAEAEVLEKDIKHRAKFVPETQAHTLLGHLLQLVWSKPKPKWNEAKIEGLVTSYNALLLCVRQHQEDWAVEAGNAFRLLSVEDLKDQPDGYWSIRDRGK